MPTPAVALLNAEAVLLRVAVMHPFVASTVKVIAPKGRIVSIGMQEYVRHLRKVRVLRAKVAFFDTWQQPPLQLKPKENRRRRQPKVKPLLHTFLNRFSCLKRTIL